MGFFTVREHTEFDKSPATQPRVQPRLPGRVQEKGRNSVRDDSSPRQRPADTDLAGHFGSLLQRAAATSLREIDDLISLLRRRRETLLSESARMQSEILEYTKLNQTTLQSAKVVTERLAFFNKTPDVPGMGESQVANISNHDALESGSKEFAHHGGDQEGTFRQAEKGEIPTLETS
jgi:hypothetical protein